MEKVLPKGWVETPIENLFSLVYGKGISTKDLLDSDSNVDLYDVYGANGIIGKFSSYSYKNSKVIISCRGAASGKIHKTNPYSFVSSNSIILDEVSSSLLNLDFVKYVMTIAEKTAIITGTAQPQITIQLLKDLKIPLPPLAEQERIVTKLDKLFAQQEKIKAALDRIPRLLKNFRQQVLTHAVTGKLTEQWREGKELEDWTNLNLIDVIVEKPRNGYSPRAVEYATPLKSLSLSATTSGKFNPSFVKYIDEEKPPLSSHLWLKNGDILLQRSNSLDYVGTAAIYDGVDFDFIYPDIMMKVRAKKLIEIKYLYFILSSEATKKYYRENATGTAGNMPKINQDIVSKTPLLLPALQEQQEIVRMAESLFAKADAIEAQYQALKAKIDNLPQAILHKAFKGELVPQLPTDGDAKDLLDEILALKKDSKGKRGKQ